MFNAFFKSKNKKSQIAKRKQKTENLKSEKLETHYAQQRNLKSQN